MTTDFQRIQHRHRTGGPFVPQRVRPVKCNKLLTNVVETALTAKITKGTVILVVVAHIQ
jgi:hypothetical protein